jgi:uncharacterized protein YjbI with pentapeptide repeats
MGGAEVYRSVLRSPFAFSSNPMAACCRAYCACGEVNQAVAFRANLAFAYRPPDETGTLVFARVAKRSIQNAFTTIIWRHIIVSVGISWICFHLKAGNMANQEQVAILKRGTPTWNAWREAHPDMTIDLESADLSGENLEGANLTDARLSGANLSCSCLKKAQLVRASLQNANMANAEMAHANFAHAHLTKANLAFADLEDALVPFADMREVNLSAANLTGARAEDTDFRHANLSHASLKKAVLSFSDFRHTTLIEADLQGANIASINLEGANVSLVKYDRRIFRALLKETGYRLPALWKRRFDFVLNTTIRCKGNHASACYGSQRFKLFLQDQDFLEEMMESLGGKFWCFLWWVFADCGRSLIRWAIWSILIAHLFAFIYWMMGPTFFSMAHLEFNLLNMLYYSIVTFTTLGFGDISPNTTGAAFVVSIEVISGYIMLGGLISIFSGKLSRRSS